MSYNLPPGVSAGSPDAPWNQDSEDRNRRNELRDEVCQAISMVDELLGSEGAAQDDVVYKFASDVYADQTTEISFMEKMLATIPAGPGL